jgi:hypothetical protein
MPKKVGRPDDKLCYIDSVLSILNYSDGLDEDLKSGLNKLNAKEIVVLNCYLSKSLNYPLSSILENIPLETPAQMIRCKTAIEHYNNLELKNANYTTEANETNEIIKTEEAIGAGTPTG